VWQRTVWVEGGRFQTEHDEKLEDRPIVSRQTVHRPETRRLAVPLENVSRPSKSTESFHSLSLSEVLTYMTVALTSVNYVETAPNASKHIMYSQLFDEHTTGL